MSDDTPRKVQRTEAEWRELLTPFEFHVLREAGTERAFTGEYWRTKDAGTYVCRGCETPLFRSETKFASGCGWPSFYYDLGPEVIEIREDRSFGMVRVEIRCARCDGHLGHVFPDGPPPTGQRYCLNSASLVFEPQPH